MKVLKGFALAILGIILFISLSLLGLAIALNATVMNPDFIIKEMNKLDVTSLVKEQAQNFIPAAPIPPEYRGTAVAVLDKAITTLEPWVKQQVNTAIYSFYDYFKGINPTFSITINTQEIKQPLHDIIRDAFLKSPPKEFSGVPQAMLEQQFEQFWSQYTAGIPQTYTVTESVFPDDARQGIRQAREYIRWYQDGYKALIALIVVLVLGIVLIHRQVRGATRGLGTTALVVGAEGLASFYLANYFARPPLAQLDVPIQVKTWLPQVLTDVLAPLQMYAIGLLAAGAILIIISFVYKPAEEQ